MRRIAVEVEQLESCAARMEEKNQDYLHHCDLLFQSVETMSNAWNGEDNRAFTSQIASSASSSITIH